MNTPLRTAGTRSSAGFSLIELIVVIALIGIAAAIASPSYGAYVERNRATQAINRYTTDVAYARMLAVRSGRETRIQPFDNGARYEVQWNSADGWQRNRNVPLSDEFRGVTLEGGAVSFDARGLRSDVGAVTLRQGDAARTIQVSAAGRVLVSP